MISLTPNSTPMDVNSVREILTLISDPTAAEQRLEELNTAAERATEATDKQNGFAKELAAKSSQYEVAAAKLASDRQAFDTYNKTRGDELTAMAASLNDRMREFEIREHDSLTSLAAREEKVGTRERNVQSREDAVAQREQKADGLIATYNQKLATLRSLAT